MQRILRHDSDSSFIFNSPCLSSDSSALSESFSSDSDSASTSPSSDASTSASASSSLASSPALPPSAFFTSTSIPDLYLCDPKPSPGQLTAYAASIIRNEAYALLALAARMTPVDQPVVDEEESQFGAESVDASPMLGGRASESRTNESFRRTVEGLASLPPHGKVLFTGVGKSGIVAQKLVATFNSLGIPSVFLHPLEALHGDLGVICPCSPKVACDALVFISHSGATGELMRLLPVARPRLRMMVAMTRDPESILARACGNWLDTGTGAHCGPQKNGEKLSDEADSALPAPTSSVVAALAVGDALALSLSRLRLGWDKDGHTRRTDFFRCHPGGQLGIALGRETRTVVEGSTPPPPPFSS